MDGQSQSSPQPNDGAFFTVSQEAAPQGTPPQGANPAGSASEPGAGGTAGQQPAGADGTDGGTSSKGVFVYKHRDGREEEFTVRDDLLNEDGTINALRAAKQATNLRAKMAAQGVDPDAEPVQPPESYAVNVPEDLADLVHVGEPDPDNPKPIAIGPDDPTLKAMTPVMQELGLPQEQADKLIGVYLGLQAEQHRQAQEQEAADIQVETDMVVAQFGTKTAAQQAMAGELGPWLATMMKGDEQQKQLKYAVLSEAGQSGALSLALWDIYQGVRGRGMAAPAAGQGRAKRVSETDLQDIQKRPEYWNSSHPDYERLRREVREGYQQLYPQEN